MNARKWLLAPQLFLLALVIAAGISTPQQSQAASMSDYLENKFVDALLRGQTYTMPTTVYVALETAAGSDTGCGTEASYTGYARGSVASSLANWAGTQSAASTTASTGTGGTTSNNGTITIGGSPTSGPTTVTGFCVMDASSAGNMLFRAALTTSKTINNGDATPSFAAGALTIQIDN